MHWFKRLIQKIFYHKWPFWLCTSGKTVKWFHGDLISTRGPTYANSGLYKSLEIAEFSAYTELLTVLLF